LRNTPERRPRAPSNAICRESTRDHDQSQCCAFLHCREPPPICAVGGGRRQTPADQARPPGARRPAGADEFPPDAVTVHFGGHYHEAITRAMAVRTEYLIPDSGKSAFGPPCYKDEWAWGASAEFRTAPTAVGP